LEAIEKYATQKLTVAEMTRATFTITDLSQSDLDFIHPLLPTGQSCIVAIARSARGYRLYVGFDHRVTEGLVASKFLMELKDRLLSFTHAKADASCSFCRRPLAEETTLMGGKGLLHVIDADGKDALACRTCWNGW
jgi:hypothetical protein